MMSNNHHRLTGLRILNTRPQEQGKRLSQAINAAGGTSIDLPALTIEPTSADWLNDMPDLRTVHQAIFISTNAVNCYFTVLEQYQLVWPQDILVFAIGKASASALTARGVRVDHVPTIADSEHVLQLDALQQVQNHVLLLIKGENGRPVITESLRTRGAHVIELAVYRRGLPKVCTEQLNSLWQENKVDIILFTSQQAMHNLFLLLGEQARDWLCSKPCLVISKRLAEAASSLGIQTIYISSHETLLNSLYDYNQGLL